MSHFGSVHKCTYVAHLCKWAVIMSEPSQLRCWIKAHKNTSQSQWGLLLDANKLKLLKDKSVHAVSKVEGKKKEKGGKENGL